MYFGFRFKNTISKDIYVNLNLTVMLSGGGQSYVQGVLKHPLVLI